MGCHRPVIVVVVCLLISVGGAPCAMAQEEADVPVTVSAEVNGGVSVPSAARLALAAWRVTVPPGTSLRAATLPGPILIAVEAGELIVGGPRRQWADGSSRLAAGEVATLGPGARIRPRSKGATPATFLFVSLFPAGAAAGGARAVQEGTNSPTDSPTEEDA